MLRYLTAGESHGPELLGILEGLPAGLRLEPEELDRDLARRQGGYGRGERMAIERDRLEITAGWSRGLTTGAPLGLRIRNRDHRIEPEEPWTVPRPGHADWAGSRKYGHRDLRLVAERASARKTAMRVAVGAVARGLLRELGLRVGSLVESIGPACLELPDRPWPELLAGAAESPVSCPDPEVSRAMVAGIDRAREEGESLGGRFVLVALGVPPGLGSHVHWDRALDGRIAGAVMSIPAVKGVEIGGGFGLAELPGSRCHDGFDVREGRVVRSSNRAGGLEGGMTNGQAVVVRGAMKPIPGVRRPLPSVDLERMEPVETGYRRSDVCAVPAAAVVGEAVLAWELARELVRVLGGDRLDELKERAARRWPDPA